MVTFNLLVEDWMWATGASSVGNYRGRADVSLFIIWRIFGIGSRESIWQFACKHRAKQALLCLLFGCVVYLFSRMGMRVGVGMVRVRMVVVVRVMMWVMVGVVAGGMVYIGTVAVGGRVASSNPHPLPPLSLFLFINCPLLFFECPNFVKVREWKIKSNFWSNTFQTRRLWGDSKH